MKLDSSTSGLNHMMMIVHAIDEDPATTPSVEFKPLFPTTSSSPLPCQQESDTFTSVATRPKARAVRFCEEINQVYNNNTVICIEDCAKLWYSRVDFQNFRMETRDHVQDLRTLAARGNEVGTWTEDNALVYQLFCNYQNAQQLRNRLPKTTHTVGAATCGVERRAIFSVADDVVARRRQLTRDILTWQEQGATEQALLKLSRRVTRPSRLYARHVAVVSAAAQLH